MVDSLLRHRRALVMLTALTLAAVLVLAFIPGASAGYAWNDVRGPGDGDARALVYDAAHGILFRGTGNRGVWKYQTGVWTNTAGGLSGYTINALVYDQSGDVLYAGTQGHGVWRCVTPGSSPSWASMGGGTGAMNVEALLMIGAALYAGTTGQGIWRCTDPGVASPAWTYTGGPKKTTGSPPVEYRLTAKSLATDGTRLYAGTADSGVWRCANPGAATPAWSDISAGTINGHAVNALAHDGTRLFAGTTGYGVWRCSDPSAVSPAWSDIWRCEYTVNSLLHDGTHLYAGLTGGVRRSDNPSGTSPGWSMVGSGVSTYKVLSLACSTAGTTLYTGTETHGVALCSSPATSPSWSGTGGTVAGYTVLSVARDTTNNILYAGTEDHGVWRCANPDTNPTWTSLGGAVSSFDVSALAYDGVRNILYGATFESNGLYRCTSPNTSPGWTYLEGVERTGAGSTVYVDLFSLAYDPDLNILYVGAASEGVWRVTNPHGSPAWSRVCYWFNYPISDPVNGYTPYSLTLDNDAGGKYLYAGTGGEGVWRHTVPQGTIFTPKWDRMSTMLFQTYRSLHYDNDNGVLYAGGVGAIRCDNPRDADPAMITWTRILSIASGQVVHSIARDSSTDTLFAGIAGGGVWRCSNSRTAPSWTDIWGDCKTAYAVILSGTRLYTGGFQHGVNRCDTRGSAVPAFSYTAGGVSDNTISALAYDAANNVVFAAAEGYQGVWRCDDPDTSPTWSSLGGDIADYTVKSLSYDGTHLYAGTWSQGVWRCDDPLTSPLWTNISGRNLYGIDASSASSVWAVGAYGTILHYNGSAWSWQESGTTADLYGVSVLSATTAWAVGDGGTILRTIDGGANWASQASGTTHRILGVDALNANNAWAVGDMDESTKKSLVLSTTDGGSTWNLETTSSNAGDLHSVTALATDDVWVVGHEGKPAYVGTEGTSSILHFNGSSWDYIYGETQAYLRGVSALDASNIWSVGGALEVGRDGDDQPIVMSSVFKYNGSEWIKETVPTGTKDLYGVDARTASDVWAVGDEGNVLHYNGSAWSQPASGVEGRLNGVAAVASNDVWVVGDTGMIIHYNGSSWSVKSEGVAGFTVDSLAYDSGSNTLFAGPSGKGLWRCTAPDSDPSWKDMSGAVSGYTFNALAWSGGPLYCASSGHGVWRCDFPLVDTPTWTDISDPGWDADSVFSLAYDGTHLYAGHQGVWRCDDPGTSADWTDTGGSVSDSIVSSLAYVGSENVLLAGTRDRGVWRGIEPDTSPIWLDSAGDISRDSVRSLAYDGTNDLVYAGTEGRGARSAVVGPIPTVVEANPASGLKGTTLDVNLTGAETNFVEGTSAASFGTGVTVNSTSITDANHGAANITILDTAPAGERDVNVTTGAEIPAPLVGGFEVVRPRIAAVDPPTQGQGRTLDLLIWGENTHFAQGLSVASVSGPGVTVNSTDVINATSAIANITISLTATPGTRQVNVVTGSETPDALAGFKITAAVPHIDRMYPTSGPVGTEVTIMGKNFGSSRGSSKVTFNGKKASSYGYWSANLIRCVVPEGASTGMVKVTTAAGTSNGTRFSVTSTESPVGVGSTWYLAEGSTDWGFDTYISITNPNTSGVLADITYMTKSGPVVRSGLWLPPLSQTTLSPRADIGNTDFSTKVECTTGARPIVVDRTMTWTGTAAPSPEGHNSIGVSAPAKTWYLPEGSSAWGFETWLLIQNPGGTEAPCNVTYMVEGEGPVSVTKTVPAYSRATYNISDDIGAKDASIMVDSPVPVIPERSMYRNSRREGHDSIGTTAPALDYFLAEGTTNYGFSTYVLIQNPGVTPVDVVVTYMTSEGPKSQAPFTMAASSRKTINVNNALPGADFSTWVHATGPVVAERAMYWGAGSASGEACHDSIGMARAHRSFYLPDGETSNGHETFILVQNPNPVEVEVEVTYLTPTGSGNSSFNDTIPANTRRTYNMADRLASSRASAVVECKTDRMKIMAERAVYWNARGAGTDTIGGFSD